MLSRSSSNAYETDFWNNVSPVGDRFIIMIQQHESRDPFYVRSSPSEARPAALGDSLSHFCSTLRLLKSNTQNASQYFLTIETDEKEKTGKWSNVIGNTRCDKEKDFQENKIVSLLSKIYHGQTSNRENNKHTWKNTPPLRHLRDCNDLR